MTIRQKRPCTVYRAYDCNGVLLYVGSTYKFKARKRGHELRSDWFKSATRFTTEQFGCRRSALDAERAAIISESPVYNRTHKPRAPMPISQKPAHTPAEQVAELRRLIEAAGLNQMSAARVLQIAPRAMQYYCERARDEPVPQVVLLAMRHIAEHGVQAA